MRYKTRREFMGDLGQGLLAVGLGATVTRELGYGLPALEGPERLDFGALEALAAMIQETPPDGLQRALTGKLAQGLDLRTLVAASSLANARTFGGHDYDGYHVAMACAPSFDMASRLSGAARALPVLKVVWRNAARIQAVGGRGDEALTAVTPGEQGGADAIQRAIRARDLPAAEAALAASCRTCTLQAFDDLQPLVQEDFEVHRVVLAWRAYDTVRFTGDEHALTLLRQALHFCADAEQQRVRRGEPEPPMRALIPALLDEHGLTSKPPGTTRASDAQLEEWCGVFFAGERAEAARFAAEQLGAGHDPEDLGQALSLAAAQLLLCDPGRSKEASHGRRKGSVHGASVGVHASDSARAWRDVARVAGERHAAGSLVAGAYHTAGQSGQVERAPVHASRREEVAGLATAEQLSLLREAIERGDQGLACVAVEAYGAAGGASEAVIELLLDVAVRSDGALHAEKIFVTATQDFAEARPAFRWRHLTALARVSASEAGRAGPGVDEARELLGA